MKIKRRSNRFLAAVLSLGTVAGAVVGSALMAPAPQAKADDNGESEVVLNLLPVMTLTVPQSIEIDVTPTSEGAYESASGTILAESNAENGFAIYISTKTAVTDLKHDTLPNTYAINSVSGDVALSTFENSTSYKNQWGYVRTVSNVDTISPVPYLPLSDCSDSESDDAYGECITDNYNEVTGNTAAAAVDTTGMTDEEATAAQTAARTARQAEYDAAKLCSYERGNKINPDPTDTTFDPSAVDPDSCELTIGVKADTAIAAGTYSNTIVVTAVPNI